MSFLPSSSCYHFSPSGYQTAAGIAFVMNRPGKRKADDSASPNHGHGHGAPASPTSTAAANILMPTGSPFAFGNAANPFAAPGSNPPAVAAHQPRELKRRAMRAQDPVVPWMPPQQVPPAPMDVCDDQGQDSLNAMAVEGADADAGGSVGGNVTPAWAIPLTGWSQYSSPSLELAQARVPAHQCLPSDAMDMS
ncbi:hypothetical protein BCR44DRAFT_1440541 [Catenaria anguillulae PL171]|uniref:Uncharacterized protein n=1 Tax=Catenaria anguillulae PL171 TaxID=765915 RepID=A0A1Y2HCK7_9FUNG|nr:hypothetical protein BCR44DRAFT_1440541 [Catenaria anguillulae PL171]